MFIHFYMYITINNDYSGTISEETLLSENEDIVGIFSAICRIIDELKIANFSVLFKEWDKRFNHPDFLYDFSDVAHNLPGLLQFLATKSEEYSLGFHELDRIIKFKFQEGKLFFSICNTEQEDVLYNGELDAINFKVTIEKLINDFKAILSRYFPKAYEVFLKEQYIITE